MSNSYINDFTECTQIYYKNLKKFKPLPKEIELDLIKRAKKHDINAQNKVLTANLKFVFNIAKNYKGKGVQMEDLISMGNLGLIKALDKFDADKDVKFISYGVWWIKQSIQEFIKKEQKRNRLEISDEENKKTVNDVNLFDDDIYNENEVEEVFEIDTSSEITEYKLEVIKNLLDKLDARGKFIIQEYYGFNGESRTLEEIGEELGITRERVRQIKDKNIRILKAEALMMDSTIFEND